jgi:hypothetical protein
MKIEKIIKKDYEFFREDNKNFHKVELKVYQDGKYGQQDDKIRD